VYRYVMRRIWWAYPLYVLSVAPVLSRIFDRGLPNFCRLSLPILARMPLARRSR
jgi:hypothetical protein